ncbi:hypothetical protein HMPREF1989_02079, partial [Porphyromonas gingivalis F0566]
SNNPSGHHRHTIAANNTNEEKFRSNEAANQFNASAPGQPVRAIAFENF